LVWTDSPSTFDALNPDGSTYEHRASEPPENST
jgi:hypothetical protein